MGRLLITLLLCQAGVLREPLLYLSLYLKQHRSEYYDLLNDVRRTGDWESWLAFFLLEGVRATASGAVGTSRRLTETLASDRAAVARHAGRRAGSALSVHDALKAHPILSLSEACTRTELSFPTVSAAMRLLMEQGIVRELTGRRRNRLYVYDRYLRVLNEETESP